MENNMDDFDLGLTREILENITKLLKTSEDADESTKRAMVVLDDKEEFVTAMILDYSDNQEGMPGNYSLSMTFAKEDIEGISENNIIYPSLINYVEGSGISADSSDDIIDDLVAELFTTILDNMKAKPFDKDGPHQEITFTMDGYFTITRGVEDGEEVFSIVPGSVLKRLIKDDELLENTIEE